MPSLLMDGQTTVAAALRSLFLEKIISSMDCSSIINYRFGFFYSNNLNHYSALKHYNWQRYSMFSSSKNKSSALANSGFGRRERGFNNTSRYICASTSIHSARNRVCVTQMWMGLKMRNFWPANERWPAFGREESLSHFRLREYLFWKYSAAFERPTYVWKTK